MARRSYLVYLLYLLLKLCTYIGNNHERIENRNPTLDMSLVDAVVTACRALSDAIELLEPHGP